jgi:hypothetical protein
MVIKLTTIGQQNYMEGKVDDFKLSSWFNNPDILFTPTNRNGKVTLTTKPKINLKGNLYSTLKSGKPNPNSLTEFFGFENDWSPDGKYLAVGSPLYDPNDLNIDPGRVYLYNFEELSKTNPQPFNILQRADIVAFFGYYIRWSPDGTKLAVGASINKNSNSSNLNAGSVFIYNLKDIIDKQNPNPSNFILPTGLPIFAYFGGAVNWNYDGSQLAIGAYKDVLVNNRTVGSVYIYNTNDYNNPVNIIIPPSRTNFTDTNFGYKVEFDSTNKYLAIGANYYDKGSLSPNDDNSGAVYIYSVEALKTTLNPEPVHTLVAQTNYENLGRDLKWSPNGKYLAVGAPYASNGTPVESYGKVYIYKTDDFKSRNPLPIILSVKDSTWFGSSVDWNKTSTRLAIGSSGDNNETNSKGSVYIFDTNKIESDIKPIQKIVLMGKIIVSFGIGIEGLGTSLRWHPSGRFLAASAHRNNNDSGSLFILN